jgi:hypothetical protein
MMIMVGRQLAWVFFCSRTNDIDPNGHVLSHQKRSDTSKTDVGSDYDHSEYDEDGPILDEETAAYAPGNRANFERRGMWI